jgi:small GTP-binding protein
MKIICMNCEHVETTDKDFFVKLIGGAMPVGGFWAWSTYLFAGTGFAMAIVIAIIGGGVAMLIFKDEIVEWIINKDYKCPKCGSVQWKPIDDKDENAVHEITKWAEEGNVVAEGRHVADRTFGMPLDPKERRQEQSRDKGKLMSETLVEDNDRSSIYLELEELDKTLENLDADKRSEWLGIKAIEVAHLTSNQSRSIENAIENGKRMLLAAQENFRLGIIGEFRVGKSTLINALIGKEIAFTDIMEATAAECLFHFVEDNDNQATINYKDGSTKSMEIEEMNQILDINREDEKWLSGIDYIAYAVNSERLKEFDLWDAPGIGGSDDNERLANRFLEKLGGAIWVIDITLVGKASINRPLMHLKQTGKPVICVLNRIDEYEGNIAEVISFIGETYPELFTHIIPMSAVDELDTVLDGKTSASIEKLWSTVLATFGIDQVGGAETRLKMTIEAVNNELAAYVSALRRSVQDQVGFCEHIVYNLKNDKKRLLANFPSVLGDHADRAFNELETEIWTSLDAKDSSPEDREKEIENWMTLLKKEETYDDVAQKIKERVSEKISSDWSKSTRQSINISRTALAISVNHKVESIGNSTLSDNSDDTKIDFKTLSDEALDDGYHAGGVSVVVAATLAAVSASVSWPVILVALPIGALAAWKKQRKLDRSLNGLGGHINQLLNQAKSELLSKYSSEIEDQLNSALDKEIDSMMLRRIPTEVGIDDTAVLKDSLHKLEFIEGKLGKERENENASLSPKTLFKKLSQSGDRLDIVITDSLTPLTSILSQVTPETKIRLILVTNKNADELKKVVENCFGNWQGQKKARAVICNTSPYPSSVRGMIISSEFAVQTNSSLANMADQNAVFTPYEEGRLVAEHIFALLWDGKATNSEEFDVVRLY